MKILLFGGSGQLGLELKERAKALNFELVSPVSAEVNIANLEQVLHLTRTIKPDLVINSAAYTAVDNAEKERDEAFRINAEGSRNVAEAARESDCRVFYVSTDYVFSGQVEQDKGERAPYTEEDATNPLSVYGASKLAGEVAVQETHPRGGLIIRTSSLFGKKGPNFVQTMLNLFSEGREVRVIEDQIMSPTWAGWLAEAILDLARMEVSGIVHASCRGEVSWCKFAETILALSNKKLPGAEKASVIPTLAEDYQRPAKRPIYSVMDCSKLTRLLGRPPIQWDAALAYYLEEKGLV